MVELDVDAGARLNTERALPFALITGELVGNAFEHGRAADSQEPPQVKVEVSDERLVLEVADRGPGLPPTFVLEECRTLGLRLVRLLARQLGGDLRLSDPPGEPDAHQHHRRRNRTFRSPRGAKSDCAQSRASTHGCPRVARAPSDLLHRKQSPWDH